MKKITLISFILIFSQHLKAEFMVEANYSWMWHAANSYTGNSGERATYSANGDIRFLGLGGRFIFRELIVENLNIEPFLKVYGPAKDFDRNKLFLFEVGGSLSYSFAEHVPFISILIDQAEIVPENELSYQRGLGFQVGYRLEIENHNLILMHSWKTLNSENPSGGVHDQVVTLSVFEFGYGYSFR